MIKMPALNKYVAAYLVNGTGAERLTMVGVDSIEWPAEQEEVCRFCGAAIEKCRCGSTYPPIKMYGLGQAEVTLSGLLPDALKVFTLPEGARIDLILNPCGTIWEYQEEMVIIRLSRLEVLSRSMPNIIPLNIESTAPLRLRVVASCDVYICPDGERWG